MQNLSRIAHIICGNLAVHQTGAVVPRGYMIPLDTALKGIARFARRLGGHFPVLTPHNTMKLDQAAMQGDYTLKVGRLLETEIPIGSIVSVRGLERHFVTDVNSDEVSSSVSIGGDGLLADHAAGSPVYLHGYPISVESAVSAGSSTVALTSGVPLVLGDVIDVLTDSEVPGGAVSYTISGFTVSGGESSAPFTYTAVLNTPLGRALAEDERVYLRAYPAFVSELLPLPTQHSIFGANIGPFVWDVMDSRMHDGIADTEVVLAIETTSSGFEVLDSMAIMEKNSPHWRVPLESSVFLFFDVLHGRLDFDASTKYTVVIPDEHGDLLLTKTVRPDINSVTWRATFEIDQGSAQLLIGFHLREVPTVAPVPPSGYSYNATLRMYYREYTLSSGINVVEITSPAGYACDRIEIGTFMDPDVAPTPTRLTLRDWAQNAGRSSWVRYTMMAPLSGDYTWGATGLLIKPMFFSADHLRMLQRFNSGLAMV